MDFFRPDVIFLCELPLDNAALFVSKNGTKGMDFAHILTFLQINKMYYTIEIKN